MQPEAGAAPGSGSGSLDGGGGGDGGGMECWTGEHWVYVLCATVAFAVYAAISLRLLRVGGELGSLEVRRNVFDWSGDAQRKLPHEHPLSFQNPTHGTVTSAGKLLVVAAQVLFGTNHPAKTMAFMLCVFAGLCAASFRYPPYYGALANRGRHFLDFAVLWVHLNTLLFYLTGSSLWVRAALPAQLALTAIACVHWQCAWLAALCARRATKTQEQEAPEMLQIMGERKDFEEYGPTWNRTPAPLGIGVRAIMGDSVMIVDYIKEDSAAHRAGLRIGMRVVEVDSARVQGAEDFKRLAEAAEDNAVTLACEARPATTTRFVAGVVELQLGTGQAQRSATVFCKVAKRGQTVAMDFREDSSPGAASFSPCGSLAIDLSANGHAVRRASAPGCAADEIEVLVPQQGICTLRVGA